MLITHNLLPVERLMTLSRPISALMALMTSRERYFCVSLPEWPENKRWCIEHAFAHAPYPRRHYYATDRMHGVKAFADTIARDAHCAELQERPMTAREARSAMIANLSGFDSTHGHALSSMSNARLWSLYHHLLY